MNTRNGLKSQTIVSHFDAAAATWSRKYEISRFFRERLEIVLSLMPSGLGQHVLDYGCGSGVMLQALLERGFRVAGADLSPRMIAEAQAALEARPDWRGKFSLQVLQEPFPDGPVAATKYDGVLCLGVLEYVQEDRQLLKALAQLLKAGGFLILSVPNRWSLFRSLEQLIYRFPWPFRALGWFPHLTGKDPYLRYQRHQYTVKGLDATARSAGLRRRALRYYASPLPKPLAALPLVGMTIVVKYQKTQS